MWKRRCVLSWTFVAKATSYKGEWIKLVLQASVSLQASDFRTVTPIGMKVVLPFSRLLSSSFVPCPLAGGGFANCASFHCFSFLFFICSLCRPRHTVQRISGSVFSSILLPVNDIFWQEQAASTFCPLLFIGKHACMCCACERARFPVVRGGGHLDFGLTNLFQLYGETHHKISHKSMLTVHCQFSHAPKII